MRMMIQAMICLAYWSTVQSTTLSEKLGKTSTSLVFTKSDPTPTKAPSLKPTKFPRIKPTRKPSSFRPTFQSTNSLSPHPSQTTSLVPSAVPSTPKPTLPPSKLTASPSIVPTLAPSKSTSTPSTVTTTLIPSTKSTTSPSIAPTLAPSKSTTTPSTVAITLIPSTKSTTSPSIVPTLAPSKSTTTPSITSTTAAPSSKPTIAPSTLIPSPKTTTSPSVFKTAAPSSKSTIYPSTLAPSVGTTSSLTPFQSGVLNVQNAARAATGQNEPALTWDTVLAPLAEQWAANCVFEDSGTYGGFQHGSNAAAMAGYTPTGENCAQLWVNEKSDYSGRPITSDGSFCNDGNADGCGHYTQIVWKTTTSVGCGMQLCNVNSPFPSFSQWYLCICFYSPPGNYLGQTPY